MPLIKENAFVEDLWIHLNDGDALTEDGDIIVTFERLEKDWSELVARHRQVGVTLRNVADPYLLRPFLDRLSLITLEFPAFADGRAYSQAKIIRNQLGFKGELRATGNVLADQAALMERCGFDSFEVGESLSIETWKKASEDLKFSYQRDYRGTPTKVKTKPILQVDLQDSEDNRSVA